MWNLPAPLRDSGPRAPGMGQGMRWTRSSPLIVAMLLGGCVGGEAPFAGLTTGTVARPEPISVVEAYSRIAKGARSCWLRAGGALGPEYIFHADVPGGQGPAEIVLHARDRTSENQRGLRTYRIVIVGEGDAGGAVASTENLKLPFDVAERMRRDVRRWTVGGLGCRPEDSAWATEVGPDEATKVTPKSKAKPKPKTKAAPKG